MKILCIGLSSYDITYPLEEYLIENTKNRIKMRYECGGGPSNNAAYLLGKWGMDVYYAGCVGSDLYGKKVKEELEKVGVNTDFLETKKDVITVTSTIIANVSKGTRTILTYCPDNNELDDIELNFNPDIILMDGQEYKASLEVLKKYPNAISIIDASRPTEQVIELAGKVNYLVCAKSFAEKITGIKIDYQDTKTIFNLYQSMKNIFKNKIIVTLEAKGALYEKDGQIRIMPSINVKAIDSTGAGDIFHGAFTYAIANNFDIEKAIKFSNIAGALSVTKIGAKQSVPTKEEVEKIFNEYK